MTKARRRQIVDGFTADFGTTRTLKRLVFGLNRLAACQLVAQARGEAHQRYTPSVSELAAFDLRWEDCLDLASRGLIVPVQAGTSRLAVRSRLILTNAAFLFLQKAIPAGALRPVYDIPARTLYVACEVVLRLAVQARSQAAVLIALQRCGWEPRVAEPLEERPGGNDGRQLVATAHNLNLHQALIDFHADDEAVTWNWRPTRRQSSGYLGRRRTVTELSPNFDRT